MVGWKRGECKRRKTEAQERGVVTGRKENRVADGIVQSAGQSRDGAGDEAHAATKRETPQAAGQDGRSGDEGREEDGWRHEREGGEGEAVVGREGSRAAVTSEPAGASPAVAEEAEEAEEGRAGPHVQPAGEVRGGERRDV